MEELARFELKRHARYPSPLTIGLIDIDRFKEINTRYLLPGGDEALKGLARILTGSCARWTPLAGSAAMSSLSSRARRMKKGRSIWRSAFAPRWRRHRDSVRRPAHTSLRQRELRRGRRGGAGGFRYHVSSGGGRHQGRQGHGAQLFRRLPRRGRPRRLKPSPVGSSFEDREERADRQQLFGRASGISGQPATIRQSTSDTAVIVPIKTRHRHAATTQQSDQMRGKAGVLIVGDDP